MDANRLELTGPATPLVYGVAKLSDRAEFDVSNSGTLIYRAGTAGTAFNISWLYSSGKTEPVTPKPGAYLTPRLSPDGKRLAVALMQEGKQNIWVYDLSRETWTRLTSGADPEMLPTWTPDGEFLAFRSGDSLAWTRSDGSGKWSVWAVSAAMQAPGRSRPTESALRFGRFSRARTSISSRWSERPARCDWPAATAAGAGGSQRRPCLSRRTAAGLPTPRMSRTLRNLRDALLPTRDGEEPQMARVKPGGMSPIWSQNGRELFYQTRPAGSGGFLHRPGRFVCSRKAQTLVRDAPGDTGFLPGFDVAPDDKRVLALLAAEDAKSKTLLRVLLNVDSELRRRAPASGRKSQ